jgi:hypothetical protein
MTVKKMSDAIAHCNFGPKNVKNMSKNREKYGKSNACGKFLR